MRAPIFVALHMQKAASHTLLLLCMFLQEGLRIFGRVHLLHQSTNVSNSSGMGPKTQGEHKLQDNKNISKYSTGLVDWRVWLRKSLVKLRQLQVMARLQMSLGGGELRFYLKCLQVFWGQQIRNDDPFMDCLAQSTSNCAGEVLSLCELNANTQVIEYTTILSMMHNLLLKIKDRLSGNSEVNPNIWHSFLRSPFDHRSFIW